MSLKSLSKEYLSSTCFLARSAISVVNVLSLTAKSRASAMALLSPEGRRMP